MRWKITENKKRIEWIVNDAHRDDVEMAGRGASFIVTYGKNGEGGPILEYRPVFPTLRLRPNNTHASYQRVIKTDELQPVTLDGVMPIGATPARVTLDGVLTIYCAGDGFELTHRLFPADTALAAFDMMTLKNTSGSPSVLRREGEERRKLDEVMGPMGINVLEIVCDAPEEYTLAAGEEITFSYVFTGRVVNQPPVRTVPAEELEKRRKWVAGTDAYLRLDTGDDVVDTMFAFAKIRSGESVFNTKAGPIHCPGGRAYYAATWCNDQVEYSGPWFAMTGDPLLLEAALNAYRMYIPFMSDSYKPIPCSVIAEGLDYWNGAGDRGDAAMYLYGASHYVLFRGDKEVARELWGAIKWCAEYCRLRTGENGVVASDSDELEHRFPSGDANLCTSTLCYSGLLCAAVIAREFGEDEVADEYASRAGKLGEAIERHFGANVGGYDTYRYFEGCELLRSWICMPLCVGLFGRADGTAAALTGEKLMCDEGVYTEEGCPTIWDRSTLYTLRGLFAAGRAERAGKLFTHYCETRLLGERVPYAVESYPEGNKRHLSAESALFAKIVTEGMLDIVPTGFSSFTLRPTLPDELDRLYFDGVVAFGATFGVHVDRDVTRVIRDGIVIASAPTGQTLTVDLE